MSDKPTTTTKPTTPRAPAGEPIPVRALHFNRPNGISIPGSGKVVNTLDARPKTNEDGWEIHLLPWIRQYQVRSVPLAKGRAVITFLVPESWAIAELAE